MRHATLVRAPRQTPLRPFTRAFTRPGYRRLLERITGVERRGAHH